VKAAVREQQRERWISCGRRRMARSYARPPSNEGENGEEHNKKKKKKKEEKRKRKNKKKNNNEKKKRAAEGGAGIALAWPAPRRGLVIAPAW